MAGMSRTKTTIDATEGAGCGCADLRCECGNLVARLTREGVEIKCRRCKRLVVIVVDSEQKEVKGRKKED